MPDERRPFTDLELALQGLADSLGVALVAINPDAAAVAGWQYPSGPQHKPAVDEHEVLPLPASAAQSPDQLTVLESNGRRRFVVPFRGLDDKLLFVQSADLPEFFPWIDGKLEAQILPGVPPPDELIPPEFLLGVLVGTVCRLAMCERAEAGRGPMDDLDVENIRRIGTSLRRKIRPEPAGDQWRPYSLEGTPSLDSFFVARSLSSGPVAGEGEDSSSRADLTEMLKLVTTGTKGSFNLMSLSGDFLIETPAFESICREARKRAPRDCFASDVRCLIAASLLGEERGGIPSTQTRECARRFSELFAPIFTDRLLVGVVFGGQIIASQKQRDAIEEGLRQLGATGNLATPRVNRPRAVDRTKGVVAGLAALVGLLCERYCFANNEALLLETLVALPERSARGALQMACQAAKRLLSVTECSAFRQAAGELILEATTSPQMVLRSTPRGLEEKTVEAREAIGRAFYAVGEGHTGRAAESRDISYVASARDDPHWAGRCSELGSPEQCILAPILHVPNDERYGVLRAVRRRDLSPIRPAHRELFGRFARQLAIVLRSQELARRESEGFKQQADRLQSQLAEGAHELKAPLHNVLQLATALSLTYGPELQKSIHQKIKEEVYRAKRRMDNYLLRGIEGREDLRYDFRPNKPGKIIEEASARFKFAAMRKGVSIEIGAEVHKLPEIVCDKDRVDQVFSNVIDNAVKYSFDNTIVRISGHEARQTVTVSVSDLGLGIPESVKEDVFEGYQRAVEDQQRFKPGTGLGLMIARRIVRRHGGNIQVESVESFVDRRRLARMEGYETTFRITLPRLGPGM